MFLRVVLTPSCPISCFIKEFGENPKLKIHPIETQNMTTVNQTWINLSVNGNLKIEQNMHQKIISKQKSLLWKIQNPVYHNIGTGYVWTFCLKVFELFFTTPRCLLLKNARKFRKKMPKIWLHVWAKKGQKYKKSKISWQDIIFRS